MNAAVAQSRSLYLPGGTYCIGTTITLPSSKTNPIYGQGFTLRGDGMECTIIQTIGDATGGLSVPFDANDITFENFTIRGTGAKCTAAGILFNGGVNSSGGPGASNDSVSVHSVEALYF